MKKRNKLQKELFARGLVEEGNTDKINLFKKAYRAKYAKEYNKEFVAKNSRKTLIFTPEEMEYLQEQAKKYQMKLSPFLKATIFAYLNSTFIFPEKDLLTNIEITLREINNRIAESIQYIHFSKTLTIEDIQQIKLQISQIEKSLSDNLKTPPSLENWLDSQVKKDEMFLPKLLKIIANYLTV